jgi:hypothetical protein
MNIIINLLQGGAFYFLREIKYILNITRISFVL